MLIEILAMILRNSVVILSITSQLPFDILETGTTHMEEFWDTTDRNTSVNPIYLLWAAILSGNRFCHHRVDCILL